MKVFRRLVYNNEIEYNLNLLKSLIQVFIIVFVFIHFSLFVFSRFPCKHGYKMRIYNGTNWEGHSVQKENCYDLFFPRGAFGKYKQNFSVIWRGYIYVDKPSIYEFFICSDDGSYLFIDGVLIIDNSGIHSPIELSNKRFLTNGLHKIEVKYYQNEGDHKCVLLWKRGGDYKEPIWWDLIYAKKYNTQLIELDKKIINTILRVKGIFYQILGLTIFLIIIKTIAILFSFLKRLSLTEENKVFLNLILILVLGLVLRFIYIPFEAHRWDFYNAYLAMKYLFKFKWQISYLQIYEMSEWNYPPGWLLILYPFYAIWNFFFPQVNLWSDHPGFWDASKLPLHQYTYRFAAKFPIVIVEIVTFLVIFKIISARHNKSVGLRYALLYFLNPAILFVSSCQGSFDSVCISFGVFALCLLILGKYELAGLLMGFSIGTKMFGVFLIPIALFILIKNFKGLIKFFVNLFGGVYLCFAFFSPFQGREILYWFLKRYKGYDFSGDFTWWDFITDRLCPSFFIDAKLGPLFFIGLLLLILFIIIYILNRLNKGSLIHINKNIYWLFDWAAINIIIYLIITQFVNWSHAIIIFPMLVLASLNPKVYYTLIFLYLFNVIIRWPPNFYIFNMDLNWINTNLLPLLGALYSVFLFIALLKTLQKLTYYFSKGTEYHVSHTSSLPLIYANLLLLFSRQYIIDIFKSVSICDYFLLIIFIVVTTVFIKYFLPILKKQ